MINVVEICIDVYNGSSCTYYIFFVECNTSWTKFIHL